VRRRVYRGGLDVGLLQAFNAAAIAQTGGCGFVHPGDIPHRLFNGNKLFRPAEVLTIWEDDRGVAAWALIGPRFRSYDAQVRPDLRSTGLEREVLENAERALVDSMERHRVEGDRLACDAFRCDETRARLLTELGWVADGEPPWVLNRISLDQVAEPSPPPGYSIRSVRGFEEAAALAEVHAAAFGSTWTPEMYRKLMQSPGYSAQCEFVVEAPGGSLAAFTVTWLDAVNRTGLFEPVGTHPDHRRRGLGKALLRFAMGDMAAAGMRQAIVVNDGRNLASAALYRSVGFEPWHLLDGYTKPMPNPTRGRLDGPGPEAPPEQD
jgi:mycothiol synthase